MVMISPQPIAPDDKTGGYLTFFCTMYPLVALVFILIYREISPKTGQVLEGKWTFHDLHKIRTTEENGIPTRWPKERGPFAISSLF